MMLNGVVINLGPELLKLAFGETIVVYLVER